MRPVCAAQVRPAQAIYLFPLAFPKSASAQTAPQAGRHLQLQPGRVLLQVRRGQRRVPRRRRVSVRRGRAAACGEGPSPLGSLPRPPVGGQAFLCLEGCVSQGRPLHGANPLPRQRRTQFPAFSAFEPSGGALARCRATLTPVGERAAMLARGVQVTSGTFPFLRLI